MDLSDTGQSFVGRARELSALRAAYAGPQSAFWPIYGRRRVGKSELILHFSRPHPTLYLLGKKGAPAEQLMREFLELAAVLLEEPLLATAPIEGWKKVIAGVLGRWRKPEKLILVFDEFQWLAEKSPELASVLQELWDRSWQKSGRVFLILCGSYVGFMEREVLGEKSPLFGRRTGQILLKPFGYREAAAFHPRVSLVQKAMTYFICGGIPLYLRYFDPDRSILQNIEQSLLSELAPLYHEPDFLLREELREIENYYMILMALSEGSLPGREIARRSGVGDRAVYYYLDQLSSIGYVDKHYPLTAERPKVRDVRYRLLDPLLRFWFHFIYPHTSRIAQAGPARALSQLIEPQLDAYFGRCFENLCREALPSLYGKEQVGADFRIGSYWSKDVQIDVVGLRADGWIDLGECKWGAASSPAAVAEELEGKVRRYPNSGQATLCRRLFLRSVRSQIKALPHGVRVHSLEDLYA
jgi:AAA+ ATPase superfamily predicted ATPase